MFLLEIILHICGHSISWKCTDVHRKGKHQIHVIYLQEGHVFIGKGSQGTSNRWTVWQVNCIAIKLLKNPCVNIAQKNYKTLKMSIWKRSRKKKSFWKDAIWRFSYEQWQRPEGPGIIIVLRQSLSSNRLSRVRVRHNGFTKYFLEV